MQTLYDELAGFPGVALQTPHAEGAPAEIVVPLRLRDDDGGELAFFGTIATFDTAVDVTLAEVAVEAF